MCSVKPSGYNENEYSDFVSEELIKHNLIYFEDAKYLKHYLTSSLTA